MHKEYDAKGLKMIAVYCTADSKVDTEEATRAFVKSKEFAFPVLYDAKNLLRKQYQFRGYPSAYLVTIDPMRNEQTILWTGDPRTLEFEESLQQHLIE